MIDFLTVKGWEIPEGIVKQVTDATGRVLWSAVKLVKLTITSTWNGMDGDTARITVRSTEPFAPDPSNPSNKVTSWTVSVADEPNRTIEVPVGSTIECYVTRDKENADSYIMLNDVKMVSGTGTYVYTVTGDVTIDVSDKYSQGDFGTITITGAVTHISFIINGETYQAIEGMTWKAWFASSYNTTGETKGTVTDSNGNEVSMDAVIIGGTAYEVGFAEMVSVTINGTGDPQYCYVTIDGVKYYSATTINVPVGTVMICTVDHPSTSGTTETVTLNGTMVANKTSYTHVITTNMTVSTTYMNVSGMKLSTIQLKEV